ncbi:hypothetical protein LTR66_007049 [Elasticomyces elasticus]|nr:hypothetical protein LTR66_007049 [Elasticomyces elasticus]
MVLCPPGGRCIAVSLSKQGVLRTFRKISRETALILCNKQGGDNDSDLEGFSDPEYVADEGQRHGAFKDPDHRADADQWENSSAGSNELEARLEKILSEKMPPTEAKAKSKPEKPKRPAGNPFETNPRSPVRVHRAALEEATLKYFKIRWHYDPADTNFIIMLDVEERDKPKLHEHTDRIRSQIPQLEAQGPPPVYVWEQYPDRRNPRQHQYVHRRHHQDRERSYEEAYSSRQSTSGRHQMPPPRRSYENPAQPPENSYESSFSSRANGEPAQFQPPTQPARHRAPHYSDGDVYRENDSAYYSDGRIETLPSLQHTRGPPAPEHSHRPGNKSRQRTGGMTLHTTLHPCGIPEGPPAPEHSYRPGNEKPAAPASEASDTS